MGKLVGVSYHDMLKAIEENHCPGFAASRNTPATYFKEFV